MNGFEFMEEYNKIPENQKGKHIIVMLTSSLNPKDKETANNTKNIDTYKNKPLTKEVILELRDKYLT